MYGTIELGGTKTDVAVGSHPNDLFERHRLETADPKTTIASVIEILSDSSIDAVGVASFGPLQLDPRSEKFGHLLATPKPGWSGFGLLSTIREGVGVRVGIETDVNGAALGEGRWGASAGLADHAYMTVGTGIGVGIVSQGHLVRGTAHPEAGHIRVERLADDDYPGRCPFHGACLEGMASGPALTDRFGSPDTWTEVAIRTAAAYVAQGVAALVYLVAPERIVVGGGVSKSESFHRLVREESARYLADYPGPHDLEDLVSPPGLGDLSGLAGGLLVAEAAVSQDPPQTR